MGLLNHFRDEEGHTPLSGHGKYLNRLKKDNAKLKRLISAYKSAKPEKASNILVSIHKLIDKYV